MIAVRLPGTDCLAEVIDALHAAADACEDHAPQLANRRRLLANELGDGLDALPRPIREDTV